MLLAGCLEAADLAQERLAAPEYCRTSDGITLCEEVEAEVLVVK